MPFQEVSRMQNRRLLAQAVLASEMSVSEAARVYGVSRPTVYEWVDRARREGVAALAERSRRPEHTARITSEETEALVLAQKEARPTWGAKKIHAALWPDPTDAPVCVRTIDRLLARHGVTRPRDQHSPSATLQRFERDGCNELWQMDFKGVPRRLGYTPLTILDDCSRFLLRLDPLESRSTEAVWQALWSAFAEFGMPDCILTDNGDGFNSTRSEGPTLFQARLWRLGIRTVHGRPAHPQTQGKVERFHRTLQEEYKHHLCWPTVAMAHQSWRELREDYNWNRPHEALGMRPPGSCYRPSVRERPAILPLAYLSEGALKRKVDAYGKFSFRNQTYRAGRGLAGEWVEIRPEASNEQTDYALYYASVRIDRLSSLQA